MIIVEHPESHAGRGWRLGRVVVHVTLAVVCLFYLLPLYVMVVTALKPMAEIRAGHLLALPAAPTLAPWAAAWSTACTGLSCDGLAPGFWNSVRILVPSVLLSVAIASLNGYVLAFWRMRGSQVLFAVLIFGAFIPYQVLLYPMVMLLRGLGIYGDLTGLVLVHVLLGLPILTLLFRNFFAGLPPDLIHAARIDGAGFWGVFLRVLMPLSAPVCAVALMLQVTGIWNDFLFGIVFARPETYPMTVQLNNIVNATQGVRLYNVDMAATLLTGLVPLMVYVVAGRLFLRGLLSGAVRG
ncbi:carbohydrate ABC transporter permease [Actibacterium ureilyticum]|uniref:carbohydrate ABC transporter permease n=1 Tax=Actibacterium ureilyticum TaxID=1590614 RepID=UPI001FE984C7|nr:carbohydrate ABC transporter permease [Actibacterium ureilyticum]